jgi:hypothetical protein
MTGIYVLALFNPPLMSINTKVKNIDNPLAA